MKFYSLILALSLLGTMSCHSQTNQTMTEQDKLPLCDTAKGTCEIPGATAEVAAATPENATEKQVKVIYFTDPICSSCWGIEPQLRKLKLEYGDALEIEYRMGGLLPDWSYNSGGISKPSDVAHHWDEVSGYYDMPIDGDVWLEDPLNSSYPPSIAFKAAQLQGQAKANHFLRTIREMVFLKKVNIAKWENLKAAAAVVGLDEEQFEADYHGRAITLFQEDLNLAQEYGVRGFPTMFFVSKDGKKSMVYGSKPYADYEKAILSVHPNATKKAYDQSWEGLFEKYSSLTAREFAELSGTPRDEAEQVLNSLSEADQLEKLAIKNGALWSK